MNKLKQKRFTSAWVIVLSLLPQISLGQEIADPESISQNAQLSASFNEQAEQQEKDLIEFNRKRIGQLLQTNERRKTENIESREIIDDNEAQALSDELKPDNNNEQFELTEQKLEKAKNRTFKEDMDLGTERAIVAGEGFKRLDSSGASLNLSLREALEYAIQNNLEAKIKKDDLEIAKLDYQISKGVYAPIIGSESYYQFQKVPVSNAVVGGNLGQITTESWVLNTNLKGELPYGTQYRFDFNNSKTRSDSIFQLLFPEYSSSLGLTVSQPLLRNFWINDNLRRIKVLKLNKKTATAEFDLQLQKLVFNTEVSYWDYILALRTVEINIEAVRLADVQMRRTVRLGEIGESPIIEAISAKAELEKRLEELAQSREKLYRTENKLKLLLAPGRESALWVAKIKPAQGLEKNTQSLPSLEEALSLSFEKRPEFIQIAQKKKVKDLERRYLVNQGLPQADLVGQYTMLGLAGSPVTTPNFVNPIAGFVLPRFEGGYGDNLRNLTSNDYRTVKMGLNMSWPVAPNITAKTLKKNQFEKEQINLQMEQMRQQVQTEIYNAYNAIQVAEQRITTAEAGLDSATKQLESETQKYRFGLSSNFLVLTRQNELSQASLRQATAIADYNKAVVELFKAAGIILQERNVDSL